MFDRQPEISRTWKEGLRVQDWEPMCRFSWVSFPPLRWHRCWSGLGQWTASPDGRKRKTKKQIKIKQPIFPAQETLSSTRNFTEEVWSASLTASAQPALIHARSTAHPPLQQKQSHRDSPLHAELEPKDSHLHPVAASKALFPDVHLKQRGLSANAFLTFQRVVLWPHRWLLLG